MGAYNNSFLRCYFTNNTNELYLKTQIDSGFTYNVGAYHQPSNKLQCTNLQINPFRAKFDFSVILN